MADNGYGMSKEVQSKIFDPFYTTKGVEGSGLGMSVSYGIVGKHGGNIDVISQVGKGTVFTIELPIATETIFPETSIEPEIGIKADNYRILVVDDVKEISDLLYVFLTRQGYNVDSVMSGDEAIKMLGKECYDLVICDLGMPQVSGWDVIKVADSLEKKPKIGLINGVQYRRFQIHTLIGCSVCFTLQITSKSFTISRFKNTSNTSLLSL
jgi:two-component system cell cycle sensor histidine kinase/response regulator CckA